MKKYAKLFISLACLSLGLTACKEDYFDAEAYDKIVKQSFPVENVDPTHTWSSFGTASVSVSVNTNAGKKFRVVVYKENPLATSSLTKLTEDVIIAGTPKELHFSYELAAPLVYVTLYNDKDEKTVRRAKLIDESTVNVDFFGTRAQSRTTRSQAAPAVPDIDAPYDANWVAEYLQTAKEPSTQNIWDNYDNSYYEGGTEGHWVDGTQWGWGWSGTASTLFYSYDYALQNGVSQEDKDWWDTNCTPYNNGNYAFYGADNQNDAATVLIGMLRSTGRGSWANVWAEGSAGHYEEGTEGHWVVDETFVTNFKVTGTWDGIIGVVASEGIADDGTQTGAERTVVVTGTWNLTENLRVGSLGRIIVAAGGTLNISEGKELELVNQARLVVLSGGTITGRGTIMVTNGNAVGQEGYNAGIINVRKINNNFGKFYNYGTVIADIYAAGAVESNFYNHGVVSIQGTKEYGNHLSANARIYNACQWYCSGDMRARIIEEVGGASMIIDGELMMSSSEDGSFDNTYVGLDAGALIKCGQLFNQGTSWTGPTSGGYAVVSIGTINYLNWAQETWPLNYGYFENNIYVEMTERDNIPSGNGMQSGDEATAKYKFWNIVANGVNGGSEERGNGNVTEVRLVENSNEADVVLPADPDYQQGVRGCTPGYLGTAFVGHEEDIRPQSWRFCFEDNFPSPGDYDFNDCVITVMQPEFSGTNQVTLTVRLDAVGGIKQLAGALHISGLKLSEVNLIAAVNNMDEMSYEMIPATQNTYGAYVVEADTIYDYGQNIPAGEKDVVIRLFDDAHLSMARGSTNAYGMVSRIFYNTVASWNTDYTDRAEVEPREVTFYITVKNGVDITEKISVDKLDVFIVESHGSIKYEVHTYPYKYLQVLKPYAGIHKYDAYMNLSSQNYPWALCLDGSFKYPNEWYSISGTKMADGESEDYGYTDAAYPLFHFWAQDHYSNQDWYLEENANPRYIHE